MGYRPPTTKVKLKHTQSNNLHRLFTCQKVMLCNPTGDVPFQAEYAHNTRRRSFAFCSVRVSHFVCTDEVKEAEYWEIPCQGGKKIFATRRKRMMLKTLLEYDTFYTLIFI